ncbi:hypothetical protein ACVME9_005411 [Bradyrhizobium liaoningense]
MLRLHCDRKAARAIHIKPRAPHPIERPPIFRPKATRRRIGTNCASQEQSGEIPLLCNHCGTLSKSVAFNGRTNGDTRGRHRRSRGSRADEKLEGLTMQSCRLDFGYIQSAVGSRILPTILFTVAVCCAVPGTTHAAPLAPHQSAFRFQDDLTQVRATVHRGRAVVGPRGGAVVRRGTAVVGPRGNVAVRRTTVVRPGYHGGGVRWARPGWYRWPAGGAIAAGAAIGFVTAGTAAAWAGAAPAPGMCWYYTDPSRTQGFWDYCQ